MAMMVMMAVQLRLGAVLVPAPFTCAECGKLVDCQLSHASCCSKSERTKGHYMAARCNTQYFSMADTSCLTEVRGISLVEPTARPADILTNAAVANREVAVD
eukprot:10811119-Karenia_brevis.AAC.1